MTIDEPITLVAYDPAWPLQFAAERTLVCGALCILTNKMEHIGSTAIPRLQAKPIIDIMLGVDVFPPSERLSQHLVELGYDALGEGDVPGRLYFRKRFPAAFNLHVVQHDREHWRNNLLLRDYLIAHPAQAQDYVRHKFAALAEGSGMLLDYSARKASIVLELFATADRWRHNA
jgi:GrpB-like predicted nucleotidyltransferase (UPF0157 family)